MHNHQGLSYFHIDYLMVVYLTFVNFTTYLINFIDTVFDGGPPMEPHQEPQDSPRSLSICSQVKEMVQAFLHQQSEPTGYSAIHKPGFVYLLEGDPEGVIFCTPHSLKA